MGWNDILTIASTVELVLSVALLALTADRIVYWWGRMRRWRHAKEGKQPLGKAGEEEA